MNIKNDIPPEENKDKTEEDSSISQKINDEIHEDFNNNKIFRYLKELSNHISFQDRNNAVSKLFKDLKDINPNSVLAKYLNQKPIEKVENHNFKIIPFGFNINQKEAVQMALNNQISIIESSSITSRTDAILNIVSNIVIEGKTVAIVTDNNFSASKFFKMLKQSEIDFIAANLTENEPDSSEDKRSEELDENRNLQKERGELKDIQNTLGEILENEDKLIIMQMQKANLANENAGFDNGNQSNLPASLLNQSADKIMSLLEEYTMLIKKDKDIKFLYKIKFLLKYSISNFEFYNNSFEIIEKSLIKRYNKLKLDEIDEEIDSLKNKLDRYNIEDEIKRHKENSLDILKGILYKRYKSILKNDEINNKLRDIISKYPAIITSTNSFVNCAALKHLFDYVIIDEASRLDIVTGALILSCARNVVIMGDHNQLFDGGDEKANNEYDELYRRYGLNEAYNYSNNSLLSSINKQFIDVPKIVLIRQYRDTKNAFKHYGQSLL